MRRTRGSETSQYPEEEKSNEILLVAASERGRAQTDPTTKYAARSKYSAEKTALNFFAAYFLVHTAYFVVGLGLQDPAVGPSAIAERSGKGDHRR
jgi:hypothetical protein